MPQYAAFLRAINVSDRRASGERLRSAFEELGFGGVASFRNSGNVVFEAKGQNPDELVARIEGGLKNALGFDVSVFLRTRAQIRAIAGHEPFPARAVEASKGKLQVALLAATPTPAARKRALALAGNEDRLALRGHELYWLPSGGLGPGHEGDRGRARAQHDAHDGHDRADRRQALRRLNAAAG